MAEKMKIIPLGGLNEVGKNMTVYEHGGEIIVVDCGMGFPDGDMYGIDLVIPDATYLVKNKGRIVALPESLCPFCMAFPRGRAAWARRHIYNYRPARSGLQISQSGAVRPEGERRLPDPGIRRQGSAGRRSLSQYMYSWVMNTCSYS